MAVTVSGTTITFNNSTTQDTASLGFGQTWQSPSRAVSTVYQNTTGRPIQVCASTRGAGGVYWQVSMDNSTWFNTLYATGGGGYHDSTMIIPNNTYYRINGSATIDAWTELR